MSRLFSAILVLIAIGLFFGYTQPTFNGAVAMHKQKIQDYDSALLAADRFKMKEQQLAAERAAMPAEQVDRLNVLLPDGVDNVQLILDLNALANNSGMRLGDFDITLPTETGAVSQNSFALASENPVDSIDLTMTGTGSYVAFRTFLAGLENSLRPLDLINLELTNSPTGVYSYGMTVRLYWLR